MMKPQFKLILISLLTTTIISLPLVVKAQPKPTPTPTPSACIGEVPPYISPANLAMMAYQGYLEKQGIPGYQVLQTEYSFGNITAAQIVQAAIKGCLMSDKYGVGSHQNYIQDLAEQMQLLIQENSGR